MHSIQIGHELNLQDIKTGLKYEGVHYGTTKDRVSVKIKGPNPYSREYKVYFFRDGSVESQYQYGISLGLEMLKKINIVVMLGPKLYENLYKSIDWLLVLFEV